LGNNGKNGRGNYIYVSNAAKIYMGKINRKQSTDGKILKSDVTVDKNYLNEVHLKELNQIVSAYLDLSENRVESRTGI